MPKIDHEVLLTVHTTQIKNVKTKETSLFKQRIIVPKSAVDVIKYCITNFPNEEIYYHYDIQNDEQLYVKLSDIQLVINEDVVIIDMFKEMANDFIELSRNDITYIGNSEIYNNLKEIVIQCYYKYVEKQAEYDIEDVDLYSEKLYTVSNVIYDNFNTLNVEGELMRILAAQRIGETETQISLNSFYHAGLSTSLF